MCSDIMRCPRDTVWKPRDNREKNQKKDAAWALAAGGSGFWSAETLRIAEWYDGDPSYPLPLFKANPVRTQVFKIRPYIRKKNCSYRLLILYWSRFSSWQLRGRRLDSGFPWWWMWWWWDSELQWVFSSGKVWAPTAAFWGSKKNQPPAMAQGNPKPPWSFTQGRIGPY